MRCKNRPPAAQFLENNWDLYLRRFERKTRDAATAWDLCQELWSKLARLTAEQRSFERIDYFVARAADNLFRDWWRKERRRRMEPFPSEEDEPESLESTPEERLADRNWNAAVRAELDCAVRSRLLREVLAGWDEDAATLAARLSTTPTAVRTYRHKLVRRLRENRHLRELWLDTQAA